MARRVAIRKLHFPRVFYPVSFNSQGYFSFYFTFIFLLSWGRHTGEWHKDAGRDDEAILTTLIRLHPERIRRDRPSGRRQDRLGTKQQELERSQTLFVVF